MKKGLVIITLFICCLFFTACSSKEASKDQMFSSTNENKKFDNYVNASKKTVAILYRLNSKIKKGESISTNDTADYLIKLQDVEKALKDLDSTDEDIILNYLQRDKFSFYNTLVHMKENDREYTEDEALIMIDYLSSFNEDIAKKYNLSKTKINKVFYSDIPLKGNLKSAYTYISSK